MFSTILPLALAALSTTAAAKAVPANVRTWYNNHYGNSSTANYLAGPFEAYYDSGARTTNYVESNGVVYLQNINGMSIFPPTTKG
jgi:hypothetical protein